MLHILCEKLLADMNQSTGITNAFIFSCTYNTHHELGRTPRFPNHSFAKSLLREALEALPRYLWNEEFVEPLGSMYPGLDAISTVAQMMRPRAAWVIAGLLRVEEGRMRFFKTAWLAPKVGHCLSTSADIEDPVSCADSFSGQEGMPRPLGKAFGRNVPA